MKFSSLMPFRVHHYPMLSLSNLCPGVEMRIYTEIMHFARYDKYCHGLTQNPYFSGQEIYILSHH